MNPNLYIAKCIAKAPATLIEMASRKKPFLVPKPQMRKEEFDYNIPGGCIVRIFLKNGNEYEGTQFINPQSDLTSKTRLKLINVSKLTTLGDETISSPTISGILEFCVSEIDEVYIVEYKKPKPKRMKEMVMETYVVRTRPEFNSVMEALMTGNVTEVGFKMFGFNKGRFMDLFWIVLCMRQTLIPIDMKGELRCNEVWIELKQKLFENENILKVVHDIRYESDYLFHTTIGSIQLKNVFDCQLAIYFMDTRAMYIEKKAFKKRNTEGEPPEYKNLILNKLSLALTKYLGNVVREREILLLYKYEMEDWTRVTYYMDRPLPPPQVLKNMALSVKYLCLLKTELMSDMMLCYNLCCQRVMNHMKGLPHFEAALIVEDPSRMPSRLLNTIEAFAIGLNLEKDRTVDPDILAIVKDSRQGPAN